METVFAWAVCLVGGGLFLLVVFEALFGCVTWFDRDERGKEN